MKLGEGDRYEGKVRHTELLLSDNQGLVDGITRDGANMETKTETECRYGSEVGGQIL